MAVQTPATYSGWDMWWIKFVLCCINLTLVYSGLSIILKSRVIYDVYDEFDYFLDAYYFSPATILIVAGGFIIVLAFFGCCGALRESTCMVLTFAFLVSTMLILEFMASMSAYVFKDNVVDFLGEKINFTMHQYDHSTEAKKGMDFLQGKLQCCGLYHGPSDWIGIHGRTSEYDAPCWVRHCKNLLSCSNYLMEQSCFRKLADLVNNSAAYLISAAAIVSLIQIILVVFSCMLGRRIRKQKTLREMHKWQMRTTLTSFDGPLEKPDSFTFSPIVHMEDDKVSNETTRPTESKNHI